MGKEVKKSMRKGKWAAVFAGMLCAVCLAGCGIEQTNRTKLSDLDYTILAEEEIPEELFAEIEEKKEADFKMTYEDSEYLYIVRGYGEQETGGYSICIRELYVTSNSILFSTELIGPGKGETVSKSPSCPYVVVRTKLREESVVFE